MKVSKKLSSEGSELREIKGTGLGYDSNACPRGYVASHSAEFNCPLSISFNFIMIIVFK